MITVAALSPSLDLTYLVDTLTVGHIHRTAEPIAVAGGKALNMVRAARTMGAACLAVALLGGPTGRQIAELLVGEGLDLVPVESGVNTRTCVSIGSTGTGELTELYAEAAPVDAAALPALIAAVDDVLPDRPGWLSMSGRTPGGGAHAVARLVDLAHQHGVRVAVDTHSEALPAAVAHRPDLIKINRAEAAQLLDQPADSDLVEMASMISARSGGLVVLTDGPHGAVAVTGTAALRAHGSDRRGSFPVGSGDAFLGGLVAALDTDVDLDRALAQAMGCAVANAMAPGQGRFDRARADRFAAEMTIDAIS
jgi:1-phosphofructokinase family hexose kinase